MESLLSIIKEGENITDKENATDKKLHSRPEQRIHKPQILSFLIDDLNAHELLADGGLPGRTFEDRKVSDGNEW